jgi:hypothetical protein
MNSDYENELQARIDRELKALPPLQAPASLVPRVMAAITGCATVPWHRRAWQTWPAAWRVVSLAILVAAFGGLCLVGWELTHGATFAMVTQRVGGWLSVFSVVWRTVSVLGDAARLAVTQIGTGFIIAGLAVAAIGYAAVLALGTACARLAYARR